MAKSRIMITLDCPVNRVWDKVMDFSNSEWRSDLSKSEIVDPSHFIEVSKSGITTYFTVVCQNKYQKLSFLVENKNMKGKWEGLFICHDNHTTLDFLEDVVSKKLILRPFIKRYLRKQQSLYVADLIKALDCREVGRNQIFMETGGVKQ